MRILVKKIHECECECEYSNMCIRMHSNANTEYEYPMPDHKMLHITHGILCIAYVIEY